MVGMDLPCSFCIKKHKVEANRRHLIRFNFISWPMILFMFATLMPVRQPSAPNAERAPWMVVGMAFQVVLLALCLGDWHWT